MSRAFFAFGQVICTCAAQWLFFWPGGRLLSAAEWCQRRAAVQQPRAGPPRQR